MSSFKEHNPSAAITKEFRSDGTLIINRIKTVLSENGMTLRILGLGRKGTTMMLTVPLKLKGWKISCGLGTGWTGMLVPDRIYPMCLQALLRKAGGEELVQL